MSNVGDSKPAGAKRLSRSTSPARGRHARVSETESAIFAATERLLGQVPLHEISVRDIIAEAQISRATFYLYFSSKYSVVSSLLGRVMDEIYAVMQTFVIGSDRERAASELRRSLEAAAALWATHRPVLRATHEHWYADPELRDPWLSVVERFTEAVAMQIDRGRGAGVVPPGPRSRQLAAALLWGSDRCMYVAGIGADPHLPGEQEIAATLAALWVGAIFGSGTAPRQR